VGRSAQRPRKRVHARPPAARAPRGRARRRPAPRKRPRRARRQRRASLPRERLRPERRPRSAQRRRSRQPNAPHQRKKPQRRSRQWPRRNRWPRRQSQPRQQRLNRRRGPWRSLPWPRLRRRSLPPRWAVEQRRRVPPAAWPRQGHPRAGACQAQAQARARSLIGRPGRETTTTCSCKGRGGHAPTLPYSHSVSPTRPPRFSRSMPSSQCSASCGWSSR
jgi:hypothetical protein